MWALVVYALAFLSPEGKPVAVTFHPVETEAECRVMAARGMDRPGYFGLCQHFPEKSSPRWPGS